MELTREALRGEQLKLHPRQRNSAVREARFDRASGTFALPGRSTAAFVQVH